MTETSIWHMNIAVWTALAAWTVAQLTKQLSHFALTRKIDFRYLVSTGGMPSAHSSMVCGLATSISMQVGFGTPLFALTLAFAAVTMFDAQSVRRAAGQQARLLNQIIEELFTEHTLSQQKMAEFLGHTQLEVFLGAVMGILVGLIFQYNFA